MGNGQVTPPPPVKMEEFCANQRHVFIPLRFRAPYGGTWRQSDTYFWFALDWEMGTTNAKIELHYFVAFDLTKPEKGSVCTQFDQQLQILLEYASGRGGQRATGKLIERVRTGRWNDRKDQAPIPHVSRAGIETLNGKETLVVTIDVTHDEVEKILKGVYREASQNEDDKLAANVKRISIADVWVNAAVPGEAKITHLQVTNGPGHPDEILWKDWVPMNAPDSWMRFASWARWYGPGSKRRQIVKAVAAVGATTGVLGGLAALHHHRTKKRGEQEPLSFS